MTSQSSPRPETSTIPNEHTVVWRHAVRRGEVPYPYADGRERFRKFHSKEDAWNFAHARMQMRNLIAELLGMAPDAVQLETEANGRPLLRDMPALSISWSRTGGNALAAASFRGRLGVDVEEVRKLDLREMLALTAANKEAACVLAGRGETEMLQRFFRLWCAKEAVLKHRGTGLAGDMLSICVPEAFLVRRKDSVELEDDGSGLEIVLLPLPPPLIGVLARSADPGGRAQAAARS